MYKFPDFRALLPSDRCEFAKTSRLFCNCLKGGHVLSACPSKASCFLCGHRHHTLLHTEQSKSLPVSSAVKLPIPVLTVPSQTFSCHACFYLRRLWSILEC